MLPMNAGYDKKVAYCGIFSFDSKCEAKVD